MFQLFSVPADSSALQSLPPPYLCGEKHVFPWLPLPSTLMIHKRWIDKTQKVWFMSVWKYPDSSTTSWALAGVWTGWSLEGPSNPNCSVILWTSEFLIFCGGKWVLAALEKKSLKDQMLWWLFLLCSCLFFRATFFCKNKTCQHHWASWVLRQRYCFVTNPEVGSFTFVSQSEVYQCIIWSCFSLGKQKGWWSRPLHRPGFNSRCCLADAGWWML